MDSQALTWKRKLLETLDASCRGKALVLSGGVDSGTLLAGLLELGERPPCYTFQLGAEVNPDLAVCERMARDYELDLRVVRIQRTPAQLERDVRSVISMLKTSRKTSVQCCHPMVYLAGRMNADGQTGCILGTGAVVLDDRRVMVLRARYGERAARDYRRDKLGDRYADCGTGRMHEVCRIYHVPAEEPYSDDPLASYALSLSIADLARGPDGRNVQKGIAWRAFPEFWGRPGYWRRNSSFQVSTGIREWHQELLTSPLNSRGAQRVVAIYNDILAEEAAGAHGQLALH